MVTFDFLWQVTVGTVTVLCTVSARGLFASRERLRRMASHIGTSNHVTARLVCLPIFGLGVLFLAHAAGDLFGTRKDSLPSPLVTTPPGGSPSPAQSPEALRVQRLAEELNQAFTRGDYERMADLTWPGVVEEAGGREELIELLRGAAEDFKRKGVSVGAVRIDAPGVMVADGAHTFAVLPTATGATTPRGKLAGRSFLLAISTDGGRNWQFVEGAGLVTPAERAEFVPKLPQALSFPPHEPLRPVKE